MVRKLLGLLTLTLIMIACETEPPAPYPVRYTLPPFAVTQLTEWVGDFDAFFAESKADAIPQDYGEYELFTWLLTHNDVIFYVPTDLPSFEALEAGRWVLNSYNQKQDIAYSLRDNTVITRQMIVDAVAATLDSMTATYEKPDLVPIRNITLGSDCNPLTELCTQYANPQANYSTTNYTEGAGDADADWFDELDEGINGGSPDGSTTYWTSGSNPSSECISVDFAGAGLVTPGGGNKFQQVYHQKDNNKQVDITLRLREGGTSIQGPNTYSNSPNKNSWSIRNDLIVTGVGDWDNLQTELCASVVGGGPGTEYHVSTFELEIPNAAGARRYSTVTQEDN